MTLEKSQVINGRYRIVSLLGQGGFGAVYRAWDINLSRPCALKENLEISAEARRQFEREAQILANLSHPGLPRVIDHFVISGQGQYLVMDYIEGEDLRQIMEKAEGPLPEAQAVAWVLQVCDALHYLHTQKPPVIHRDIKPANIKITPQGRAVLVDFGIAKIYDPNLRTTSGARAVTPGYSPPEQYGQGQTDAQSDVYALGATLYNMLTGQVPPDSVDIVAGNTTPPPAVNILNPKVSPGLSAAVMRAMHANRSYRLRSMKDFQAALQGRLSLPPEPLGVQQPQTAPAVRAMPISPATPAYPLSEPKPLKDARPSKPPTAPPSRPPTAPPAQPALKSLPWTAILAGAGLILVIGVVALYALYSWLTLPTETPVVAERGGVTTEPDATNIIKPRSASSTPGDEIIVTDTQQVVTLVPSDTPAPSDTPTPTGPQYNFPAARLAFVSDHRMDGKERIFIVDVTGGSYSPEQIDGNAPFSAAQQMPALEPYDMAWWPDWCGGNQTIFFEVQDVDDPNVQTVAFVPSNGSGSAVRLSLPDLGMLGVPRCSHDGNQVLLSAQNKNRWELYRYRMDTQKAEPLGSGYTLAGYASWARDGNWFVFMDKNSDGSFNLVRMMLDSWTQQKIQIPASITDRKYPTVSPADGTIAYACYEQESQQWHLCRIGQDLVAHDILVRSLYDFANKRSAPKRVIPAVTPSWAPDGVWLAYASNKDGDWDIYLYSPVYEKELNLTNSLSGDQFQPAWSKP